MTMNKFGLWNNQITINIRIMKIAINMNNMFNINKYYFFKNNITLFILKK